MKGRRGRKRAIEAALEARLCLLATTLAPGTISSYRSTAGCFLAYLRQHCPEVSKPAQLVRDTHVLGWLEQLCKHRSKSGKPLGQAHRAGHIMRLRTLLDMMADLPQPPVPNLLIRADIPRRNYALPRPLAPEDDERLKRELAAHTDPLSCALLLQRLAGMRIGELADLAPDCLRHLGDNCWSLHVPHGKPRSERWVPVDDQARSLIERLVFLRTLPPGADPRFLLARPGGRTGLMHALRVRLGEVAAQAGIEGHIVPHQLRHTFATSMLRAGVSLPALMRLLGHHNANMTLIYVEVTQQDLQREVESARLRPRHLVPTPEALRQPAPLDEASARPATANDALQYAVQRLRAHALNRSHLDKKRPLLRIARQLTRIQQLLAALDVEADSKN